MNRNHQRDRDELRRKTLAALAKLQARIAAVVEAVETD